ncbi:MAG: 16S rRNA (uracil(1498)-N(3))-methyltransferase [Clostridia bacterium]|nr:16S rRNA (uracil(1498)-N(3))-methyltransferase [Clostridia bacterium]
MSGRCRFFLDTIAYPDITEVTLTGEEFSHAVTVQRLREGSEIVLLDGTGKEYSAIVTKVEKRALSAHIISACVSDKEPKADIYLLCGELKGDKTELVVQKAVELGASRIGIFSSEYCSAYMNTNKLERLNKVVREAAKQCLRAKSVPVEYYPSLQDALASADGYDSKIFACEFVTESDKGLDSVTSPCALIVGSEGGFSEAELAQARAAGFSAVTLGKRILRAETAAISLLSVAAYILGELK